VYLSYRITRIEMYLSSLNTKNIKGLSFPFLLDFRSRVDFGKVPRLRPIFLLLRATWEEIA